MIAFYSLNGKIRFYGVFVQQWKDTSLLSKPKAVSDVRAP